MKIQDKETRVKFSPIKGRVENEKKKDRDEDGGGL